MKKEITWNYWFDAILHSYSQIFFSLNKLFASIILLVTFFAPGIGLFGFLAVLLVNVLAYVFGFNRKDIQEGIFGFNALLFGLAMAFTFEVNTPFVVLFVITNVCLLVLTAVFQGAFGKVSLPFLSFPFLVSFWLVMLASSELSQLVKSTHEALDPSTLKMPISWLNTLSHSLDQTEMPLVLIVFFRTLAATFFQNTVLGGMLIAIGLFLFSRISFTLAFLGFFGAFWVYEFFGADISLLSQNLVGSNYLFFAIAIGCFYLIPNTYSYAISLLLIPILMLLQLACDQLFHDLNLKTFTLSFSLLTTVFLYALHQRWLHQFLHLVTIQYYSAEKTVYKYLNAVSRFNQAHLKKLSLPFWGDWQVSQGYNGSITHLGEWSKALDFVITDQQGKTYQEPGIQVSDFHCYNKPVIAPADGYIYEIVNYIDDNEIGEVDTQKNWGNTIVMNHLDGLYSQLSHLKRDSIKVSIGDFVLKGTVLASCGSSGRSPEPHVHFQLQHSPEIGAITQPYPISYFIEKLGKEEIALKMFEVPKEKSIICNVEPNHLLFQAFAWSPGKVLRFYKENSSELLEWEVFTDAYNRTYLFEKKSKSYAYFVNDGTRFYFTDYEGSRNSNLFHLYMSCYSVLLGAYPNLPLTDKLPLVHFNYPVFIWLQDMLAPFYLFTEARFSNKLSETNEQNFMDQILLTSNLQASLFGVNFKNNEYLISIGSKGIEEIILNEGKRKERWICAN